MSNQLTRAAVLLSLQRALLGEVLPALRGVTVRWDDGQVLIKAYFDGPVTEEFRDGMERVQTEVIADFPEQSAMLEVVRQDSPRPMDCLSDWVYRRLE